MSDMLDDLIAIFEERAPRLRKEKGSVWAVVADRGAVRTFKSFPEAARYAHDRYGNRQVLIRHTESAAFETAPFIHVRAGA